MHGLCKYRPTMNTSSLVLSITASVHIASRTARFLSFLSSRRNALSFHEALVFCSFDDVFSSSGFGPSSPRTGSCFSLSLQVSAAAYHRFISKRGLKGDERKAAVRNPSGTPPSGPSSKKDGVIESRCLPSNLEGSLKSARTQFDNHRESLTRGNGPLYPDQSQESGSLEHEQKVSTISRLDNFDMFDEEINDEDDEDFGNEDLDDKEYEDVADELMDLDGIEDHERHLDYLDKNIWQKKNFTGNPTADGVLSVPDFEFLCWKVAADDNRIKLFQKCVKQGDNKCCSDLIVERFCCRLKRNLLLWFRTAVV